MSINPFINTLAMADVLESTPEKVISFFNHQVDYLVKVDENVEKFGLQRKVHEAMEMVPLDHSSIREAREAIELFGLARLTARHSLPADHEINLEFTKVSETLIRALRAIEGPAYEGETAPAHHNTYFHSLKETFIKLIISSSLAPVTRYM